MLIENLGHTAIMTADQDISPRVPHEEVARRMLNSSLKSSTRNILSRRHLQLLHLPRMFYQHGATSFGHGILVAVMKQTGLSRCRAP